MGLASAPMKNATIVAAVLVLFAGGCKKDSGDAKDQDTPAAKPKAEEPKTDTPKTETPKTDTPKTEPPKTEPPPVEDDKPFAKEECASVATKLAACGSAKDATKEYKVWLIQNVFNGFDDPSYYELLSKELARWTKSPAAICKEWSSPDMMNDPFSFPGPIRTALASGDCESLRKVLDEAGGLPMPADD